MKDLLKKIENELKNKEINAIYLFGSYAKGTQNKNSDIDIAILLDKNFKIPKFYLSQLSNKLESKIKKEIHIIILNNSNLRIIHQVLKYGKLITSKKDTSNFENIKMKEYLDFKYYHDMYNSERIKRIEA